MYFTPIKQRNMTPNPDKKIQDAKMSSLATPKKDYSAQK